jgi:proton-dependent oligopeptide transporter, POT family
MTTSHDVKPPATAFGHPRGLVVLAGTEFWDRVSFHGMQALLVLYMVDQLLLPGHVERIVGFAAFKAAIEGVTGPLSTQALASQIFGLYVGLAAFTPVIGGYLGDRVLGRVLGVSLGALFMTLGHFCMAFDQSFLLAMLLLILGAGLLRGNLTPQVGELYDRHDRRRAIGFQIYGAMVNLGAFAAPLVTGALGQAYGWHAGFGFAGVGMLTGLVFYLAGLRHLPPAPPRIAKAARPPLAPGDWRSILILLAMVPLCATFWVAQSQIWNTYNIWVRDSLDLTIGSWTMPVVWLQSLDGLAPFLLLPPFLVIWRRQAARGTEPDEIAKMAIGCFIFAAGTAWLAFAHLVVNAEGRSPLLWAIAFHFGSNLGWLYFAPSAIAFFSRAAPAAVNATMVSLYYLAVTLGSFVSGRLGGFYEAMSAQSFWLMHAAVAAGGGVAMLLAAPWLRGRLFGVREAEAVAASSPA